ncbi:MAG TPA: HAMP domain-containing sensor histidine kinase [Vicinamibacterales bacterium]|nr:HAMP domain-containing sensor histidine kinase [Vicinamibacterales bacterium]
MPDVRADPKLDLAVAYSRLLSLAVHEFRTPASVVSGYLRMLERDRDPSLTERQRKMVEEAEKSCARIIAIVNELSDIGKLDGGLISLSRQPIDAFTLVGEVAELVQEARAREVHLKVTGDDRGASMSGDAPRLRAAFEGIFRAILREKAGPCIIVADRRIVTREGRTCAIVIISEEASVQDAYEREPAPFDEKRGGLGLALPLARRVIEGHDGRLWSPKPIRDDDPLRLGSAIVSLPITELKR